MQYPHRGGICRRYAWDLVILDSPKYTAPLSPHTCAPVIHQKGILRREQIVDTRATMSSSKFPAALSCLNLFLHGNIIVLLLAVSGYTCSHLALTGYDRDTQCCPCRVTQGWLSTFVPLFSLPSSSTTARHITRANMLLMARETAGIPVIEAPVLIVGSSMTGMTLSALLAKHGIRDSITVEKHASTAIHPRAALFHPKTMQIYRELGLYDQMAAESAKYYDEHAGLHAVETLAGKKLGTWMEDINEGLADISPVGRMFLTQQMFEPLLRRHAVGHGASLRFSTELVEFEQDEEGVTALVVHAGTGAKQIVRAKYMVACDGSRSQVRRKLGIQMKGHGLLSKSITIYFKADLGKYVKGKYNGVIYVNNEMVRGFFRLDKTGTEGFLVVNTYGVRGSEESRFPADGITDEKAKVMLQEAVGADVDCEITHISPWNAICDCATHFSKNRVLLAGDAAHVVTPNGGFGGNTGIQDAYNLAWKLALVLQGKGDQDLVLSTYHDERFPVGRRTVDQAFERYIVRTAPEFRTADMDVEQEVPEPHLELGYRYDSRAVAADKKPGALIEDPATAKARPGSMARHVLVKTERSEKAFPVADLLGSGFVLLVGAEGIGWVRAARNLKMEEAKWLPEMDVHHLATENDAFHEKYDVGPSGCALIRPDGFVAWSSHSGAVSGFGGIGMPGPEETLKCVFRDILCLSERQHAGAARTDSAHASFETTALAATDKWAEQQTSLATHLHRQRRALEVEKQDYLDKARDVDARLADLKRMGELQNEMAMLGMKLRLQDVARHGGSHGMAQHDLGPG